MANFPGFKISSLTTELYASSNSTTRQGFYAGPLPLASSQVCFDVDAQTSGDLTPLPANRFPVNHSGTKNEAYGAIFYNRIIVSPASLDYGNLLVDTTKNIEVFNAFLSPKTLNSISSTNVDGITLTGTAPPTVFAPLQALEYAAEAVTNEGPPTINGAYLFDFEVGIADAVVPVEGKRVLALPYLFQAGLKETLSWQTQVITSNNGYEQRIKTRRSPRQEFSFDIAVPRTESTYLDGLSYSWRGNFFGLPISSEARFLTAPITLNDLVISVDTAFGDFREAGMVMVYNTPTDLALLSIDTFDANSITVTSPIPQNFGVNALVMPVRVARLRNSPKRKTNGHKVRLNANFQVTENITLATSPAPVQYKGLDVYLDRPLTLGEFATDIYTSRVDLVDFGTGAIDSFSPWMKTKIQRNFGVQFDDLEDAWNFRLWLHRREGKLRPFWMPTFEDNFKLLNVGLVTTELIVKDEGQASLSEERNDLSVETAAGFALREIVSITPSGGNLLVVVDVAVNVEASDVIEISYLGRKRLASDRIGFNWEGNKTGNATVPVIELNN